MNKNEIRISEISISDLDELFEISSNKDVAQYMRFETHTKKNQTKDLILNYTENKNNKGFAIRTNGADNIIENELIGIFGFNKTNNNLEYDITTFIAKKFWNKGISSIVLGEMILYAKNNLKQTTLVSHVVADNNASCALMRKFDFKLDNVIYFDDLPSGLNVYKLELV